MAKFGVTYIVSIIVSATVAMLLLSDLLPTITNASAEVAKAGNSTVPLIDLFGSSGAVILLFMVGIVLGFLGMFGFRAGKR